MLSAEQRFHFLPCAPQNGHNGEKKNKQLIVRLSFARNCKGEGGGGVDVGVEMKVRELEKLFLHNLGV
jgi:hypothetical protein